MSTIGPMFSAASVEKWILDLVQKWQREYLSQLERDEDRTPHYYELLQNFGVKDDYDNWTDNASVPGCLCVSTGNEDLSEYGEDVHGTWVFGLLIVGGTNTPEDSNNFVKAHAAWVRTLFLQLPDLEHPDNVVDTTIVGERYNQVRINSPRTTQAAALLLEVEVQNVADPTGAPPVTPRDDPYGDGSVEPNTITQYNVDIQNREIE